MSASALEEIAIVWMFNVMSGIVTYLDAQYDILSKLGLERFEKLKTTTRVA